MTTQVSLIDFTELVSKVQGEGLEELTRQIGYRKGLSPTWSGRGADRGRDLIFTEILSGPLATEKITWLVSCKDKAKSRDSVGDRDLPATGIKDKLEQHGATGFLLVTTTTVSTSPKSLLDSLDKSNGGNIHTLVWDSSELTAILIRPENHDLLQQFLPQSYQRVKGLTSLEGAVLAFREQVPEEVLAEIMRLVKPYSEPALKGESVWPHDTRFAKIIDNIVKSLIIEEDSDKASGATKEFPPDAFIALVTRMHNHYPDECYEYLMKVVAQNQEVDIRFNAAQFLFDNYEIDKLEHIEVALHLDSDALERIYGREVASFVYGEIFDNIPEYELYQSLEDVHGGTAIEDMDIEDISLEADLANRKIFFSGNISIDAAFIFDGESVGGHSFPGKFSGYFDLNGMYLTSATIDTLSYFEEDDDFPFDEEPE